MSDCSGQGECFEQCCGCNKEPGEEFDVCIFACSIKYFREEACVHNCELKECHNFKICKEKRPEHILNNHGGMCVDCAMTIGKIKFLDQKGECPICLENKDMIQTTCENHRVCLKCWIKWSKKTCPLCRKGIFE